MNYCTWERRWWPSWPCWSRESVSTRNGTWKTTSPSITRWKCCSWASSWGTSFTFPRHLARLCGCKKPKNKSVIVWIKIGYSFSILDVKVSSVLKHDLKSINYLGKKECFAKIWQWSNTPILMEQHLGRPSVLPSMQPKATTEHVYTLGLGCRRQGAGGKHNTESLFSILS